MWSIVSYAYWCVFVFFDEMLRSLAYFLIGLLVSLLSFKRGFFFLFFFFFVYLGSSPSSNVFFFFFFQLEGNYLAYCDCFVHHHESVIGIHTSPPSWNSLPPLSPSHPSKLSQSTHMGSLIHTANPHLLSILHMVMYVFQCYSLKSSHPRSLPFISVSPLLPCK